MKMIESIKTYSRKLSHQLKKTFNSELQKAEGGVTKLAPRTIIKFSVPLAEHCNLRCCGCDHFAPLAEQEFADVDAFENDFARLSYLADSKAERIALMGGEPLLHPQAKEFFYIARHYFPGAKISIVTNGLLLLTQNNNFWKACKDNNIIIEITRYPINLDFEKMKNIARSHEALLTFYNETGATGRTSNRIPLDLDGGQDIRKNFVKCYHANNTIFLKKGKLYTCTIAPNVHHFNKFFNRNLPTSDRNSIDIYQAQSVDEILHFLSKPIPFCRYCYVDKRTLGHPWKRSRKDIKEWSE